MMDMMLTVDSLQSPRNDLLRTPSGLRVVCIWTVRERGIVIARVKNVFTNYGLTALASAIGGGYMPPTWLVIDSAQTTLSNGYSPGATSIQTTGAVDLVGDTQLVLNPGAGNQETVTFTSRSGTGPYTYALSAGLANTHVSLETVCRQTSASDTLSTVVTEVQYDPVNAAGQRIQSVAGFSSGNGNFTMQFYITAAQAQAKFNTVGLADTLNTGSGNLHDHAVLGYDHTAGTNDAEIDVSLTLTNV